MTMKKTIMIALGIAALMTAACSRPSAWSVEGTVTGVPSGTKMALEANNAGHWYVVDSVAIADNGSFRYDADNFSGADVMRLTLNGNSVCFPIDSLAAITLESSAEDFGTRHRLDGTAMARTFGRIDSIVASTSDRETAARLLVGEIAADTTGLVAYYAVGKSVDGALLFNPFESFGNKVYGAAAQVYVQYRPEDPRGQALKHAYFEGRKAMGRVPEPENTVIEVPETGLFDITRYDSRGNSHSLAEVAKGKVVLLSFTAYGLPSSPAYNALLNELYEKYHDKGLEIYQISFDSDEVSWKEAARSLPWIAVWNSQGDGTTVLAQYNVGAMPLTYIIDRQGTISRRVDKASELSGVLARYF